MLTYRTGTTNDTDAVVALFDANIAWLVQRGREAQWGATPFSDDPKKVDFVRGILESGFIEMAELAGEVVGASVLTDHPMPYVPGIDEEERYLKLLIASPKHRGEGIGEELIKRARERTIADGIGLMRVDCWSGGDKRLVQYYIGQGFTPTHEIEVRPGTCVQMFEWRPVAAEEKV